MDATGLWLTMICCALVAVGLTGVLGRRTHRKRSRVWSPEGRDFRAEMAVHVCGDTMHVVPGDFHDHVLERSGECGCHPGTTRAIGSGGRAVLFVDHHLRTRRPDAGLPRRM